MRKPGQHSSPASHRAVRSLRSETSPSIGSTSRRGDRPAGSDAPSMTWRSFLDALQ